MDEKIKTQFAEAGFTVSAYNTIERKSGIIEGKKIGRHNAYAYYTIRNSGIIEYSYTNTNNRRCKSKTAQSVINALLDVENSLTVQDITLRKREEERAIRATICTEFAKKINLDFFECDTSWNRFKNNNFILEVQGYGTSIEKMLEYVNFKTVKGMTEEKLIKIIEIINS